MSERRHPDHFTMDQLDWDPWLPTIAQVGLDEDVLEQIYELAPNARSSTYFGTLAHNPLALMQRTELFNNTMRSAGGAPNSDRELAAVAVSLVNGCIYCASVHARLYVQYSKRKRQMDRLLAEGVTAEMELPRKKAIVDFAVRQTTDAAGLTAADIQPMRDAGMTELEIYDVAQAAAMFNWANRLMQTLGEPSYPE